MAKRSRFLGGARILPPPVGKGMTASDLVEKSFLAYNAGRLREGARLLSERMLAPDSTVGLSLTGALTPAGLGVSCLVPLLKAGFVDWIVSTGANLYHDAHFGLGLSLHAGLPVPRRPAPARRGGRPDLRRPLRLRRASRHRRLLPPGARPAGVPGRDGDGRVPLPPAGSTWRAGAGAAGRRGEPAGGGVAVRRARLHLVARGLVHRHEHRGDAPGRQRREDRRRRST